MEKKPIFFHQVKNKGMPRYSPDAHVGSQGPWTSYLNSTMTLVLKYQAENTSCLNPGA